MRKLAISLSIIAVMTSPVTASTDPTALALEQCFERQAQMMPFSGIAVASNGKGRLERDAGFVDTNGKRRPSADVPFRLASVQKVLTGVAIGRLVDQGKISLDAPVGRYLHGLPSDMAQVTIDQLLHHQSGVAGMTDLDPRIAQALVRAKSSRDLVPLVASEPLRFPPGSRTEYSNGGYFLLGAVIESVSGRSYADFLQTQVFRPLHMTGSGLVADSNIATPLSRISPGGPLDKPQPVPRDLVLPANSAGDGASTARDLLLLGRALIADQFLSNNTKARIFPHKADPWRIGQSGGAPGENTDFSAFPDTGWVVVVLSNYDPPAGELMGEVLRKVANGGQCEPLGPNDRPSPFRLILKPPASNSNS